MSTLPSGAAALPRSSARAYASAAMDRLARNHATLLSAGLPKAFAQPIDDLEVRVLQLAASVEFDRPALMAHVAGWYQVAFHHRGVHAEYLGQSLATLAQVLDAEMPRAMVPLVRRHLDAACAELAITAVDLPALIDPSAPHGRTAGHFLLAILEGRGDDALDALRRAIAAGVPMADLHDHVLVPVQRETGRMWLMNEILIADEHYGSVIVDRALALLHEQLPRPLPDAPTVLAMSAAGNLHDFGLRMVTQRLQLAGLNVYHLGANMPADDLESALAERHVDLVALSASMPLHLHAVAATIATARRVKPQASMPVLVGGEPFRIVSDLYRLVGADAAAVDAAAAVEATRALLPGWAAGARQRSR